MDTDGEFGQLTDMQISGLGMGAEGLVYYDGENGEGATEFLEINLDAGSSIFEVASSSGNTTTTIQGRSGDDTFNVLTTNGGVRIYGDEAQEDPEDPGPRV